MMIGSNLRIKLAAAMLCLWLALVPAARMEDGAGMPAVEPPVGEVVVDLGGDMPKVRPVMQEERTREAGLASPVEAERTYEEDVAAPAEYGALLEGKEKRSVTITLNADALHPSRVYDKTHNFGYYDADKQYHRLLDESDFTIDPDDIAPGDTVKIGKASFGAFKGVDVGTYDVTVSFTLAQSDANACVYAVSADSVAAVTASITPRTIVVEPTAGQEKVYGTEDPYAYRGVVSSGLLNGDTITGGLSREPGEDVGRYVINEGTLDAGGNYKVKMVQAFFTITKKPINASDVTVQAIDNQAYTGAAVKPESVLRYGARTLAEGTDYTVAYSNNVEAGAAKVKITGKGNYSGSRTVGFNIVKAEDVGVVGGKVRINAANFPDARFRGYVSSQFDKSGDGALNAAEIEGITQVVVDGMSIESVQGIEYFTELWGLRVSDNRLTSLDVSHNPKLEWLDCGTNRLTELDVSGNPALRVLFCPSNALTALNVTKNTRLETLGCAENALKKLNLAKNARLEWLNCNDNRLTALDVSHNARLDFLVCWGNKLTKLDVTKNPVLAYLSCGDNRLNELDVRKCPEIMAYVDADYYHEDDGWAWYGTHAPGKGYLGSEQGVVYDLGVKLNGGAKAGKNALAILPGSLTTIGEEAFAGLAATVVVIPEGCVAIGARAFADCTNLSRVEIPETVTSIDDTAFEGCAGFRIYTYSGDVVEWAQDRGIPVCQR